MTKQGGWEPTGFGDRLRELRCERGLTQAEIAELTGCHLMTIAKLERGTQEPAWPLVRALCQALKVSCTAFEKQPAAEYEPKRGRPPKVQAEETAAPKRPRKEK